MPLDQDAEERPRAPSPKPGNAKNQNGLIPVQSLLKWEPSEDLQAAIDEMTTLPGTKKEG